MVTQAAHYAGNCQLLRLRKSALDAPLAIRRETIGIDDAGDSEANCVMRT